MAGGRLPPAFYGEDMTEAPRPDAPQPTRSPLFAVFLVAFAVAVVLSLLAVSNVLREPAEIAASIPSASPPPVAAPSPSPTLVPRKVDGRYRFIQRTPEGLPVRWNPCEPITYSTNTVGSSQDVHAELREALRRVTQATGIRFRPVGSTRETFFSAYRRMRYRGIIRKAALILIWVHHPEYQATMQRLGDRRPSIAFAKPMAGLSTDRDRYLGGIVVIDSDATRVLGFGSTYAQGVVLIHELGHIMGLDHVNDPDQVMSGRHPNLGLTGYGVGDREGLRLVGAEAGCLD